ncbi:hypothetical protein JVT61DRAFT_4961 [Boletus reticuloceps]|uniref:DUF6533 domain-containing protein n=1 Tax=Boletus reticuloceps TaxID=495285 RepID=A0A8I2Z0T5_9AGAM|nr:hypothetical protein JVT61DRAFT_4961 [Boletus reticuloceps]
MSAAAAAAAEAEFLALLSAEQLSKFCAIGAYTWFLYDYIIMLPTEIRYVWIKPWGVSKALFLWMRYFGVALLTVYMGILFTPSHSEQPSQLQRESLVAGVLPQVICFRYGSQVGLAFECWLAGLAVWKAVDRHRKGVMVNGQKVDLLSLLIRDSVIYFFLIAAGLASNAFIWLASTAAVDAVVVPLAHASMIVGGSRLFLNLREAYYVSRDTTTWQVAPKGQRMPQFERLGSNGLFHETMGELTGTFTVPDFALTYVELDEVDTDTTAHV